jgi:hypothetical protein
MKASTVKKLLPEIWKNKESILEGIKNRTFKQDHIEDLAKHREEICKGCVWYSKHYSSYEEVPEVIRDIKGQDWVEDFLYRDSANCLYCGCNISLVDSLKLRSPREQCPLPEPKWEAVVENQRLSNQIVDIIYPMRDEVLAEQAKEVELNRNKKA